MIRPILSLFRKDPIKVAAEARAKALEAHEAAKARRDSRDIHSTLKALAEATAAELRLGAGR